MTAPLRILARLSLAAAILCLAACAIPVPDAADLDEHDAIFRERYRPRYDELERQRAAGQLAETEYVVRKQELDDFVHQEAVKAAWTKHSLAESDRKSTGLPTPAAPVEVSAGGGGIDGNSFYKPFNDRYNSQSGSQGFGSSAGRFPGSGYAPGSSIRGNTGGSF